MIRPEMKKLLFDWVQDLEFKNAQMDYPFFSKMGTLFKGPPITKNNLTKSIADRLAFPPLCNGVKTWPTFVDEVFEKSRTLLYGAMYEQRLPVWNYEWRFERTQLFANLSSVEEVKDLMLKFKQILDYIITSTVELPNFSVSENFRSSVQMP